MLTIEPSSFSSVQPAANALCSSWEEVEKTHALGRKIVAQQPHSPLAPPGRLWRLLAPLKTTITTAWSVRRLVLSIQDVMQKLKKAQKTRDDSPVRKALFIVIINSYDLLERGMRITRYFVDRHCVHLTKDLFLSCSRLGLILASVKFGKASMKLYRYAKLQEKAVNKELQSPNEVKKNEVKKFYYFMKIVRHIANLALSIFMLLAIIFKIGTPAIIFTALYAVATGIKYFTYPFQWGMWGCKNYGMGGWKKVSVS